MSRLSSVLLSLLLLTMAAPVAMAEEHPASHGPGVDQAPQRIGVGDPAPAVVFTDSEGNAVPLTDFQGKPLLLAFFMGHWCSGCMAQLTDLGRDSSRFADLGANILVVSADPPAGTAKTENYLKRNRVKGLQVAGDPTLTAIDAFGVRMPDSELAYHSVFLIAPDGTLALVARGDHAPADLPSSEILLAELESLVESLNKHTD